MLFPLMSAMKMRRRLITLLALTALLSPLAGLTIAYAAHGETVTLPFNGMHLVYDVNLPVLSPNPLTSFQGTLTCVFDNVSATSSLVSLHVQGTLTTGSQSQQVNIKQAAALATNKDNIFFLLPQTTPSAGGALPVTSVTVAVGGYQLNLAGVFTYEGDMPIPTTIGTFTTYRLHNKTSSVDAIIDIYLHYEKSTKLMVYGELNAQSSLFSYKYTLKIKEANLQFTTGAAQPASQCIIATAAFGSELAPEVQYLRSFRDHAALSTESGGQFMRAFNAWYYSFSPSVASYLRSHSTARETAKTLLYPLIGILKVTVAVYTPITPDRELAMILAGIVASTLVGLIYFTPLATPLMYLMKRFLHRTLRTSYVKYLLATQTCSLCATFIGVLLKSHTVLLLSTSTLVLSTICAISYWSSLKIVSRLS